MRSVKPLRPLKKLVISNIMFCAVLFLLVFLIIYFISKRKHGYWKRENVPHLKPVPIFGNYADYFLQRACFGEVVQALCRKLPDKPYFGAFFGTEPVLIVQHPDMIKLVMTVDFHYFQGREVSVHSNKEEMTKNVFFTYGNRWKAIRQIFSPVFTSSKLKDAFSLTDKISQEFKKMLEREVKSEGKVDARFMMARFSLDSICSWTFGFNTNAMGEDVDKNPFRHMINVFFEKSWIRHLKSNFRVVWPGIFYGLGLTLFPKDSLLFFKRFMVEVLNQRGNKSSVEMRDFVDLLLNLKKKSIVLYEDTQLKIDDDFLTSQASALFTAGVEATSTATSYTLYELAKHPEAQKRCWDEIDEYLKKNDGNLQFDCLTELSYLTQCMNEAVRLYPIQGVIARDVFEDYRLPCGALLEKGMRIHLPILHVHRNPQFFPDPLKYKPERFSPEEKDNLIPYSFLPFSEGPRNCIGLRMGKILAIVGLVTVLKNYKVELAEGMPTKISFHPQAFISQSECGVHLKLVARERWQTRMSSPANEDKF